jgi:DNA-binding helix-hairpin-helix protein with protein kinase domain
MPISTLFDHNGLQVRLGDELGRGGEASVYALPDQPRFVAKVYHKRPDRDKAEKLLQMVALQNERILSLAAWPVVVLKTRVNGEIAGFAMPNISSYKDVHLLYSPKSRVKDFPPKVNWAFLVHAAANIARAFSVIHDHGHVIGDVNERNLRVSPDSAVVNLIDCDSFQIRSQARYFLCEVGVPTYTSSELQEKTFKTVVRTPNHDNFGLAVLIFHLLFMGRHPFAGRFLGKGEMPIERAICEHRFAYAPDNRLTQMQPPPNSLSLSQVSPVVADHFVRAFSPSGVNNGRPTAASWVNALATLEVELKKCGTNPAHQFFKALSECPWCSIEGHTGVILFVGVVSYDAASGFRLDLVWTRIQGIQRPGAAVAPDLSQIRDQIRAAPEAKRAGWNRRIRLTLIVVGMICAIAGALALGLGAGVVWVGFIAIGVARAAWGGAGKDRERYEANRRRAESTHRFIQERWNNEASDIKFQQKLAYLNDLRTQHIELPKLRQSKLQDLQRNLRQSQLRIYLEKFSISSAAIPNVGDTRKAMLASYNIDTAADVTITAVDAVPGFGQFLTGQLLAWRQTLESRFVFNANRGVDPEDVRALDKEIAGKRVSLESSLLKGAPDLMRVGNEIMVARQALAKELENAARELYQAEADARAA